MTVMVVEDFPSFREMLSAMLRFLGHEERAFASGSECLAWLDEETPDVALLDLQLPDTEGALLLERIRERGHRFPVVAITGLPDGQMRRNILDAGALAVLEKPVTLRTLRKFITLASNAACSQA
jgi:two-component system OmpR family response regulator